MSATGGIASRRPLSALLSQLLVAFTIEFDNEFERQMAEAGYSGSRLSFVVWANLMRFVPNDGVSIRDLAAQAVAPDKQVKFELGCLERWGFVFLRPGSGDDRPVPSRLHRRAGRELRDGWGSGRPIRADWMAQLSAKGLAANAIWSPLSGAIERRWEARFGKDEIDRLRQILEDITSALELELPQGLPGDWSVNEKFPARAAGTRHSLPLPALLSQLLLMFRLEFDRESQAPLALCANTLRVLGEKPIRVVEIPRLTGASPETAGIGWQLKPYVVIKPDPAASRGKVVSLSALGLRAQQTYQRLTAEIGKRWEARFGKAKIGRLVESLEGFFDRRGSNGPLLSEGLVPPQGTVRAGAEAPALGRPDIGTAARQRARDLVAQTEALICDPACALPHYPLWDMNRGFGP